MRHSSRLVERAGREKSTHDRINVEQQDRRRQLGQPDAFQEHALRMVT